MIAEVCFVLGLHGEKKGWSGKLDPHNKIMKAWANECMAL